MLRKMLIGIVVLLVAVLVLGAGISWWAQSGSDSQAQPVATPSPEQLRRQHIQSVVNRGEAQLIAYIKSQMHDPDSFELVSDRAIDAGERVTMVMVYRGRNGFNAVRTETVGATFDMQGNLTSVSKVE